MEKNNNNDNLYLKTDDNKIINENCIRWVKKMDECLQVCLKVDGCHFGDYANNNTHKICKINNPNSYEKLNKFFE